MKKILFFSFLFLLSLSLVGGEARAELFMNFDLRFIPQELSGSFAPYNKIEYKSGILELKRVSSSDPVGVKIDFVRIGLIKKGQVTGLDEWGKSKTVDFVDNALQSRARIRGSFEKEWKDINIQFFGNFAKTYQGKEEFPLTISNPSFYGYGLTIAKENVFEDWGGEISYQFCSLWFWNGEIYRHLDIGKIGVGFFGADLEIPVEVEPKSYFEVFWFKEIFRDLLDVEVKVKRSEKGDITISFNSQSNLSNNYRSIGRLFP